MCYNWAPIWIVLLEQLQILLCFMLMFIRFYGACLGSWFPFFSSSCYSRVFWYLVIVLLLDALWRDPGSYAEISGCGVTGIVSSLSGAAIHAWKAHWPPQHAPEIHCCGVHSAGMARASDKPVDCLYCIFWESSLQYAVLPLGREFLNYLKTPLIYHAPYTDMPGDCRYCCGVQCEYSRW